MATHKKSPIFIRIIASNKTVVCINPFQLSSFRIVEKSKVKIRSNSTDKNAPPEEIEADAIYFYFPAGTGLSYVVGVDITQDQFDYICATLTEFLYLNEHEFKSKTEAINQSKMNEWNKISTENEEKVVETTTKEA